tara:strand:- start:4583 stop:5308 length:726 start_codon:yes stop_codon:yes gene_type:complete
MEILAIIPARGGSKGLLDKNILPLNGHPLISYSIAAGLQTSEINRVICSTDSNIIAEVAQEYGAETPFMRPAIISQDNSSDFEAFSHALNWLELNENYFPDIVIQLRPTSPIRFVSDIQEAINSLIKNPKIDSVRAISEPITTPFKMWKMDNEKILEPLLSLPDISEPYNAARQELPKIWAQTGTLEVIWSQTIKIKKSMTGDKILGLKIDPDTYIDIDTLNSFLLAELVMKNSSCIKPYK